MTDGPRPRPHGPGLALLLLLATLLPVRSAADVVHLKDGRKLEGSVTDHGETLTVKMRFGSLTVKKSDVLRIEKKRSVREIHRARRAALGPKDVAGRLSLAAWCTQRRLTREARALYREVIALDPENATAHAALGHVRRDGKWMTRDEAMRAAGLVRHEGKWVFPEQKRLAERRAYLDGAKVASVELLDAKTARIHMTHPKLGARQLPGRVSKLVGQDRVRVDGVGWPVYTEASLEGLPVLLVYAVRVRFNPGDGAYRLGLARWLAERGHPERAAEAAREAEKLDPQLKADVARLLGSLAAARARVQLSRLEALWAGGKATEAVAGLRTLAAQHPTTEHAKRLAEWQAGLKARLRLLRRIDGLLAGATAADGDLLRRLRRALTPDLVGWLSAREALLSDLGRLWVALTYRDHPTVSRLEPARVLALEAWLDRYFAEKAPARRRKLARAFSRSFDGLAPAVLALVLRYRHRAEGATPATGVTRHELVVAADGSKTSLVLFLPPGYHPFRRWPLLIDNHGKGATGAAQLARWKQLAARHGLIVACPTATINRDRGWGGTAVERSTTLSALAWLRRRLSIDDRRVYLAGTSMGGHAAWDIGLHAPDRFAALFPMIGGPRIKHYRLVPGLRHTAVYDAQGALDDPLLVRGVRYAMKRLEGLGCRTRYNEAAALGHQTVPGAEADFLDWVAKVRRPDYPRQVTLRATAREHARNFWIEVLQYDRAALDPKKPLMIPGFRRMSPARQRQVVLEAYEKKVLHVTGEISGNRIALVTSPHVWRVRLHLAPALVDLGRPVTVTVNGKTVFEGPVRRSLFGLLESARDNPERPELYDTAIDVKVRR